MGMSILFPTWKLVSVEGIRLFYTNLHKMRYSMSQCHIAELRIITRSPPTRILVLRLTVFHLKHLHFIALIVKSLSDFP